MRAEVPGNESSPRAACPERDRGAVAPTLPDPQGMNSSYSVGIEEEYQLVDAQTGALRSRAHQVLAWDWTGDLKPEMQRNTIEIDTRPCDSIAEAATELARLRLEAAIAAEARECRLVAAGTHPFSDWSGQEFTPKQVYRQLRRDYRRLAESQNIFGMHVHVALPTGTDRAHVMNVARHYLAHLLAMSASSPFFQGTDTGYASYRFVLWRRWPRTGAPPRFADEAEYERLVQTLINTGCIDAPGRVYWDLRPHHGYPTLEFRIADVTPDLEMALAVAALARAVAAGACEGVLREPEVPDSLVHPLLGQNGWRAARDGLDATLVEWRGGEAHTVPAREAILKLAAGLAPVAERLGDAAVFAGLPALLERGDMAHRMCTQHREFDRDMQRLVLWLAGETTLGTGMDRRAVQRTPAPA